VSEQERELLLSPDGLRFRILRGTPSDEEAEVLGLALDRVHAWDQLQERSAWVASSRPGIGLGAWPPGTRWSNSPRSDYPRER
jgi:hypothetical protein